MSVQKYYLVYADLAQVRAPLDDPIMRGFAARQDEINSQAERMAGFVIQPELADQGKVFNGDMLLSVTVWEEIERLEQFINNEKHAKLLSRPEEWFVSNDYPPYVLFWAPAEGKLTENEIKKRFDLLHESGPSTLAFTFDRRFTVEAMLTAGLKNYERLSLV